MSSKLLLVTLFGRIVFLDDLVNFIARIVRVTFDKKLLLLFVAETQI